MDAMRLIKRKNVMDRNCKIIQKRLSAHQDGETTPEERAAIERHLSGCPDCPREFEATSGAWDLLNEFERISPPDNFEAEFWRKADALFSERPSESRPTEAFVPMAAVIVACLTLGIASGYFLGKAVFPDEPTAISEAVSFPKNQDLPHLDNFADYPKDSLGGAYIEVAFQTIGPGKGGSK